jgi:hypothetical protein
MRYLFVVAVCAVLVIPVSATSQTAFDSTIVLIPLRSLDEIQAEINTTKSRLQVAQARLPVAEGAEKQAQMMIDPWRKQIDLANAKVDAAKKEKNESAKIAAEAEKKSLERQKELAEKNYDLRKAETDFAKSESQWIEAGIKANEMEFELAKKRIEREQLVKGGTTGVGLAAVDQVIGELLKKSLEAEKDEADKGGNLADKHKDVVSKRLAILEAQAKAVSGK